MHAPDTAPAPYRPVRSALYVPGSNDRALDKAAGLAADAIIFDLEDSVAPDSKAAARDTVAEAVKKAKKTQGDSKLHAIRINDRHSPWHQEDLCAAARAGADAVLVPKIEQVSDIIDLSGSLDIAGAPPALQLWVMIEMPRAVLDIAAIAATAQTTRLTGFVLGFNDLAKELGARGHDAADWAPVRMQALLAARAYGLRLLDSVYNDFRNAAGFAAECDAAAALGLDGKTLIHPAQIDPANRAFAPSEADIAKARSIVAAFASDENAGKGVIQIDGEMVERLHLAQAERTLAIAQAISAG